jgi:hypothetical protein
MYLMRSVPDKPKITSYETGENFAILSWTPSERDSMVNPGGSFFVEYQPEGKTEVIRLQ